MRAPKIEKVVVAISVGEAGEKLAKAEKVLNILTNRKPVRTVSKTTNKDWGIRKGMPIGCKVTLRHEEAENFLRRAFWVKNDKLSAYSFDKEGNFSFGIADYTKFQGIKYDPAIGIFGLDVCVAMQRPGKRVSLRRVKRVKIPARHRLTQEEVKNFLVDKFKVEIVE